MFSALAENRDSISDKINGFIALAPVARIDNIRNEFFKELA
jgi:hypothetical protein